jgi:hypothetical protein
MPQDLGHRTPKTSIPGRPAAPGEASRAGGRYSWESEWSASAGAGRGRAATRPSPAPLPCPPKSNNSTEPTTFPASAGRTAYALSVNVGDAVDRWGIANSGFLTLTFADHVLDPKEAQRRLNSLTTHVLRPRYGGAVRVFERQKSGRIHYHLLVNVGRDIRTGFSFSAAAKGDYKSASKALRDEWAFWRRTAKLYRFGRTELLPIMSSAAAVSRYVGKYISKHFDAREPRDSGVRLVSYIGPKVASVKFMWAGGGARTWRAGLEALVRDLARSGQIDSPTVEAMRRAYGQRWAWSWRDQIAARGLGVDVQTGEICGTEGSSGKGKVHGSVSEEKPREAASRGPRAARGGRGELSASRQVASAQALRADLRGAIGEASSVWEFADGETGGNHEARSDRV